VVRKGKYLFTSESVAEGHPDKVCDRISDAILDAFLTHDPNSRVAVETLATTNRIVLAGEVRGSEGLTSEMIEDVARHAVKEIGYEQEGFHWQTAEIQNHIHEQSADIAQGVDAAGNKDEGAGDQGIMFGYACSETKQLMPAPIYLAHNILKSLAEARHSGAEPGLGPDAKSQVTLEYEDDRPLRTTSVVVSTQHAEALDQDEVRAIVRPHVVNVLPEGWMCDEAEFYVNPTGRFVVGGPDGDCGLTGRKIIVDTYGGAAPQTWSPQGWPRGVRSSYPMPSASPSPYRSMSTPTRQVKSARTACRRRSPSLSICRRAAFASISPLASQSLHVQPHTDISVESRRPMAGFPGNGWIWSISYNRPSAPDLLTGRP
jgi:S-adenosylmethionine synthetase